MQYLEHTYNKNVFIIYLKFRFNWASCILSGDPNWMLTGQKFPRTIIPDLHVITSHEACSNRLAHCETERGAGRPQPGDLVVMKQMI